MPKSFYPIRVLLPFLWRAGPWAPFRIIGSFIFLLLGKAGILLVPFFYKQLIDTFEQPQPSFSFLCWLLAAYGTARIAGVAFSEARDAIFLRVEQRAIRHIARDIFSHLHDLSFRFHLDRKTGSLARSMERGTRAIESFFRFFVFGLFPTILELFLVVGVVAYYYTLLFSFLVLLTLVSYLYVTFAISQWRLSFMRSMNKASNEGSAQAIDSLLNYATVKYFGNAKEEERRYDMALQDYEEQAVRNKLSLCFLNVAQVVVLTLGLVIIMGLCTARISAHMMTVGDFVLITTLLLQAYLPLHSLGFAYRETNQALIDMDDLFQLRDIPQEVQDVPNAPAISYQGGELVFQDVSFGYQPDRLILDHLSFTLKPLQSLAIVGPSGSGKSTLVSLVFRFFDPTQGRIFLDGQDLRSVSQESLRDLMGIVPQDTVLFNDTIFYNIAYGNTKARPEEVYEAARQAALDTFIQNLPQKYETIVGERGLKLSGGEKQRIAIARVILKKPKILVFDEATSALDTQTEKVIQNNLEEISTGHTTLMIAHRLSTVVHADQILVLEKGRVVERGTHHELLSQNGLYAHLWQKQAK